MPAEISMSAGIIYKKDKQACWKVGLKKKLGMGILHPKKHNFWNFLVKNIHMNKITLPHETMVLGKKLEK